ncbi:MAG TPA: L,D-transpeptidase [Bauldia sp.]|nr:L,D-transpeptidase [Bauldia sp.]
MRSFLIGGLLAVMAAFGLATAADAGVLITIDKSTQRMAVSVDGVQKYVWPVSTGAKGYTTPSGSFTPFRMEAEHYSKEWDDAPMPNSVFFTPKGHAIHGSNATRRLGSPASHGCVRLAPQNAAALFALIQKKGMYNTKIVIADRVPPAKFSKKKGGGQKLPGYYYLMHP